MKTLVTQSSWCNRKRSRRFSRQRFLNKNHWIETKSLIRVKGNCNPIRAFIKMEFLQALGTNVWTKIIHDWFYISVSVYKILLSNTKVRSWTLTPCECCCYTVNTPPACFCHFTTTHIRTDCQRFTAKITAWKKTDIEKNTRKKASLCNICVRYICSIWTQHCEKLTKFISY